MRAFTDHAELKGGSLREIENATACKGTPVIDTHDHFPIVIQRANLNHGAERQRPVGGSQITHVE
jgi:hypothetical protein